MYDLQTLGVENALSAFGTLGKPIKAFQLKKIRSKFYLQQDPPKSP